MLLQFLKTYLLKMTNDIPNSMEFEQEVFIGVDNLSVAHCTLTAAVHYTMYF